MICRISERGHQQGALGFAPFVWQIQNTKRSFLLQLAGPPPPACAMRAHNCYCHVVFLPNQQNKCHKNYIISLHCAWVCYDYELIDALSWH